MVHLVAKIGFAANEAVTALKMVEKGFKREDLALVVLIDFPFQIMGGWLAAKWSRGDAPLRPWIYAFFPRLLFALIATLIVYWFPTPPISTGFFIFLILHTVISSFASWVCFLWPVIHFNTSVQDCSICWYFSIPYSGFWSSHWGNLHDGEVAFGVFMNSSWVCFSSWTRLPTWVVHGQSGLCWKVCTKFLHIYACSKVISLKVWIFWAMLPAKSRMQV